MNFWTTLLNDLAAMGWVDWTTTITALIYVILAARDNVWCWFFGIISCSFWAYASYAYYQLYLDALLQVFYVGMSFWGIYRWQRGGQGGKELPISRFPWTIHLGLITLGLFLSGVFGVLFASYTGAAATYWDASTTIFSVIATLLLVQRKMENWLYWIVIDLLYAGLYYSRGAALFAVLMVLYTVIAFFAYRNWRRKERSINTPAII